MYQAVYNGVPVAQLQTLDFGGMMNKNVQTSYGNTNLAMPRGTGYHEDQNAATMTFHNKGSQDHSHNTHSQGNNMNIM